MAKGIIYMSMEFGLRLKVLNDTGEKKPHI